MIKNFLTRAFTSLFIFLIFGAIVATSFFSIVFEITVGFLCAVCVYEAIQAQGISDKKFYILPVLYAFAVPVSFYFADAVDKSPYYFLIVLSFVFVILMNIVSMRNFDDLKYRDSMALIFSSVVITCFLSNIIILRRSDDHGLFYMILTIVCFAWATDVFAYLVGILIGKHKFSPKISPKKSIEGCVGGTLLSVAATVAALFIYKSVAGVEIDFTVAIIYALLCSIVGQIGDFSFSYIKRSYGIKDFGKILPGHGGVLDRLDSTIFITPFFCMLLTFKNIII